MAEYDVPAEEITGTIQDAVASGTISGAVADSILNLVQPGTSAVVDDYVPGEAVAANTTILNVPAGTNLTEAPAGGQAIIMAEGTSANVVFGADSPTDTLVLGSGGGSDVVFDGDKNVSIQLTGGEGDSVTTGTGDDVIVIDGGSAHVTMLGGNNQVTFSGGQATINAADGNDRIMLTEGAAGDVTIDSGDGFDALSLVSNRSEHDFIVNPDGTITMHSDVAATMTNVNLVAFDVNGDNQITAADQVTVLADTHNEALVAKLYKVALGREPIDGADGWGNSTLGGIDWWFTQYNPDASAEQLAKDFLGAKLQGQDITEFQQKYNGMSNGDFVQTLFNNLNSGSAAPTDTVNGQNAAWYAQQLDAGLTTREDVAFQIASSNEAVQILGIDGTDYVIDYGA